MQCRKIDGPYDGNTNNMGHKEPHAEGQILPLLLEIGVAETQKYCVRDDSEWSEWAKKRRGVKDAGYQNDVEGKNTGEQI